MNAYTERTIQVREDVVKTTNCDIPTVSSRRKIAEIRGQSNRPNPMAVLDNRSYRIECRCVTERDGMPCEGSKELPIGG